MSQRASKSFFKASLASVVAGLTSCLLASCAVDGLAPGSARQSLAAPDGEVLLYERSLYGGLTQIGLEHIDRLVGAQEFALRSPAALSARGNDLYIYDDAASILYKYDLVFDAISEFFSDAAFSRYNLTASRMTSIHVAKDQTVFVADPNSGRVLRFSRDGQLITTYADPLNLSRPNGVIMDERSGQVFVADSVYGHIVVFGITGMPLLAINSGVGGVGRFQMVKDMAFGPDGLYVLDLLSKEVFVMAADGAPRYAFESAELINPSAIVVDEFNRVYISDRQDNTIRVYENGKLTLTYGGTGVGPGQFYDITDMALDRDQLYVADSLNGRVQIFILAPPKSKQQPTEDK